MPSAFHSRLRHIDSVWNEDVNCFAYCIASDDDKRYNMKNVRNFFTRKLGHVYRKAWKKFCTEVSLRLS